MANVNRLAQKEKSVVLVWLKIDLINTAVFAARLLLSRKGILPRFKE